jgi:hypothetical protein
MAPVPPGPDPAPEQADRIVKAEIAPSKERDDSLFIDKGYSREYRR